MTLTPRSFAAPSTDPLDRAEGLPHQGDANPVKVRLEGPRCARDDALRQRPLWALPPPVRRGSGSSERPGELRSYTRWVNSGKQTRVISRER